jgi:hypothetical protein
MAISGLSFIACLIKVFGGTGRDMIPMVRKLKMTKDETSYLR